MSVFGLRKPRLVLEKSEQHFSPFSGGNSQSINMEKDRRISRIPIINSDNAQRLVAFSLNSKHKKHFLKPLNKVTLLTPHTVSLSRGPLVAARPLSSLSVCSHLGSTLQNQLVWFLFDTNRTCESCTLMNRS